MALVQVDDAASEGSSFLRHFNFDYLRLDTLPAIECRSILSPTSGYYRSTSQSNVFPFLDNKNPISPTQITSLNDIFRIIDNYEDLCYCLRNPKMESVRELYCVHALNHILKSRKIMLKNTARAVKLGLDDSIRDQGFHRARVMVILPTREAARRTVHQMLRLMPKGSTVSHRKRFERDFGPQEGQADSDKRKGKKPPDFEEWFSCNSDDRFRIGIAVAKKSVKLYSPFSESDIILASPLGLETLMNNKENDSSDVQYITASIEVLVIDQAEHLLMQNWATVQDFVSRLNQRPKKPSFSFPARIRLAYLAGFAARYRQTLIFSAVNNHLINALLGKCENFQGMNLFLPVPQYQAGSLFSGFLPENHRVPGLKQSAKEALEASARLTALDNFKLQLITFGVAGSFRTSNPLFESTKSVDSPDSSGEEELCVKTARLGETNNAVLSKKSLSAYNLSDTGGRTVPLARLAAFKQRLLPRLRKGVDERVLIYVPDYYDLEELRKLLREEALSFCCVHEYLEDNEAERYRNLFDQGRIRIMLLSERYYFYRRRKIRGARNFIFYGAPTFPWFVRELLSSCDVAPAVATTASGEVLFLGATNSSAILSTSLTILYFPPWESSQVSMITASIDV
ncbi:digestive organ expansion factor [Echinococcus multilocularis]|uniref:U3 small nucleolar RNA-associated protein 25 homolog n=1 Tax=Echinococcus multilocularis TaxID=6211 RepID=A0A068Y8A7_ECHMU|nr:digestive organ expansion factor [Echinococcus multilocularis]